MRQYQLRTYHLRTEEAAAVYLRHWVLHVESLKLFGVETHAYFSVPSTPTNVVALISFAENVDPEVVTHQYMESSAFKKDMQGFDVAEIESVETLLLTPGAGTALS